MSLDAIQAAPRHREVIRKLVEQIAALLAVRRVILFGSRARGDADERSDIDIAVDAPEAGSKDWAAIFGAVEDAETLLEIQIVRLHETDEAFQKRVEEEGIVLFQRS